MSDQQQLGDDTERCGYCEDHHVLKGTTCASAHGVTLADVLDQQQPGASEQGESAEPYVRIWLEQPSGHEVAMLSAADYRRIKTERDEAQAKAERLRTALKDAIELAEDAIPYVSEHLQRKWGYAEELAKLHAYLDAATPKPAD